MNSNKFIIKTILNKVKILTINDLKSKLNSIQLFLDNNDSHSFSDSLGILVSDYHILIAAAQNEKINEKYKSRIHVMKKPIADI